MLEDDDVKEYRLDSKLLIETAKLSGAPNAERLTTQEISLIQDVIGDPHFPNYFSGRQ